MVLARARRLAGRVLGPFYRHQTFLWMWSPAGPREPEPTLPDGFSLVHGTEADLPLLAQLGTGFDRAGEFLAAGHRLWLLLEGDRLVFASWTFIGRAPTDAARTGWIELPEGTFNPEDSTTHPDYRGRGVAGLAGALIHRETMREQPRRYVFAALTTNTSSLRAAAKGPARPFAVVDQTKIGLLRRDAGWRNRRGDTPLTYSRVRVSPAEVPGGATQVEEELLAWFRSAIRTGVRGPGPAAVAASERVPVV